MPFKECLRLDNDQSFTPIEEPTEPDHNSELFAKEQGFGDEGGAGGKEQADEQEQATFYRSL